ncbi:Chthon cassette protein D [compost metagenome]
MGSPIRTRAAGCGGRSPFARVYLAGIDGVRAPRLARSRPSSGFTLIELMVVIALIAITTSVAIPSFQRFLERARADAAAAEVAGLFSLARSEAIRRNVPVTICRATTATSTVCAQDAQADWGGRWIVFQDTDNDQVRAAGEEIIRMRDAGNGGLSVLLAAPAQAIQVSARGFLSADGALALRVAPSGSDERTLNICVSRAGRVDQRTAACS